MVAIPEQATKELATLVAVGTDLDLAFGEHYHWDSEVTLAAALGKSEKFIKVPGVLINSRVYYARTTAAGNGTMEVGVDVHWKSDYNADGYDPVTQQFYVQDEFEVYGHPVVDLFLNFRIKYFCGFLKFSHCNESFLPRIPGYFVTPLYPGQKKAFDIGLSWSFFN
jgi:hypothetical protein